MGWLRRARGDEGAFMDAVFVHADGLYRYALRLAGDSDAAADLVQETLTRAFDAFGRLRPDTNHRAWAFTILRNVFLSRARHASREELLADPDSVMASHAVASDAESRSSPGSRHQFEDQVLEALEALSEPQRTAVVLCDVEEMSYEEIAQVMGCPIGTVRSRIHHARRQLREMLASHAKEKGYG